MSSVIYLDNAATSFPKPACVTRGVTDSLFKCANPGRSGHPLSLYSARAVFECRRVICSFFNFNHPENVIFTYNTTYALNMAINGLYGGGEIIFSNLEHNSVIRPVAEIVKKGDGRSFRFFDASGDDEETVRNFLGCISDKTRLCVITMCSNVTGKILPYREISEICRQKGISLIFDAAQCAGLIPIDLSKLYFSAVCFAGHKSLYGIMGTGFCIFAPGTEPENFIVGGNGVMSSGIIQSGPLPERLESGTLGVPGIIGLCEGIRHISRVGIYEIREKCSYLENRLTSALSQMKNVKVIGACQNKVSTVVFNIDGYHSEKVAALLSEKGICVRAGLHCAPLCHKALGTLETGAVRVSASHLNSMEDIDIFLKETEKIAKRKEP